MIVPRAFFDREPPELLRRVVLRELVGACARAFHEPPPSGRSLLVGADELLVLFRGFSADCIGRQLQAEAAGGRGASSCGLGTEPGLPAARAHGPERAHGSAGGPSPARERLFLEAHALGSRVRRIVRPGTDDVAAVLAYGYRCIGIDIEGPLPGDLLVRRCFFADAYTPQACSFMASFDGGFMAGLAGDGAGGSNPLTFSERITGGAPCCRARYSVTKTDTCGKDE